MQPTQLLMVWILMWTNYVLSPEYKIYLRVRAIVWLEVWCFVPFPHIWQCIFHVTVSKWADECMRTWISMDIGVSNNAGATIVSMRLTTCCALVLRVILTHSSALELSTYPFQCNRIPATKICMKPNFECNWIAAHKSPHKKKTPKTPKYAFPFKSIQKMFQLSQEYCCSVVENLWTVHVFGTWAPFLTARHSSKRDSNCGKHHIKNKTIARLLYEFLFRIILNILSPLKVQPKCIPRQFHKSINFRR